MKRCLAAILLMFFLAPSGSAAMELEQVIATVLSRHPDLALNRVDAAIAETDRQSAEGMLDPLVTASITASEDKTPVSSTFLPAKTQWAQLAAGITQPLASGASLSLSTTFNQSKQTYSNPVAASFSLLNPEYRTQIDLSYRYPLLKGAGRPDYRGGLTAAESGLEAAELNRQITARRLSLQALNLYYQLASDTVNVRIAEQAVARSKRLLAYQKLRERMGLTEASGRLQTEALLAARRTALAQARARRAADLTALNRLMLRDPGAPLRTETGTPRPPHVPDLEAAVRESRQHRPEFRLLRARLKAAEAQLEIARDQNRMQLDLVAQLGTRSLDGNAPGALRKSTSINDHVALLSLEFSDLVHRRQAQAELKKAELNIERIRSEETRLLENIRNELADAITAIRTALPTLSASRKQVRIERRKFEAEMLRYRDGRSDTATLVRFEGDLASAELQAEILRLNLELAGRQLQWATGGLAIGQATPRENTPS